MLNHIISDRIKREGPIPFREFMEMALFYPGYGYYTSPQTEIGAGGDFYTSSHIHPVFGAMLGKQIEEMWHSMERPDNFHVLEIGAGKGYLAFDMLKFLESSPVFDALLYTIVEINPHVKKKQEKLLESFSHKLSWLASLAESPPITGCIITNELLDALPVNILCAEGGKLQEVYVTINSKKFCEVLFDCRPALLDYLAEFAVTFPPGYRSEINLGIKPWLQEAFRVLREGFVCTIDYGYPSWDYYSPARTKGTLMCYYQHQVNENPYEHIGMQDITAHVNFSSVKKWGEQAGFSTAGYCPQGTFLVSLGIDTVLNGMLNAGEHPVEGFKKVSSLISPEGLGESHKVLIQYKGERKPRLSGFSLRNRVDIL
jgi:SAM-dependent MidA family methyltransferase